MAQLIFYKIHDSVRYYTIADKKFTHSKSRLPKGQLEEQYVLRRVSGRMILCSHGQTSPSAALPQCAGIRERDAALPHPGEDRGGSSWNRAEGKAHSGESRASYMLGHNDSAGPL